ncbi:MAG: hypothetical protein M0010_15205 [Actinomycetota bacterium]|nr:hypothetical protein [Actinomycetota bacterium]
MRPGPRATDEDAADPEVSERVENRRRLARGLHPPEAQEPLAPKRCRLPAGFALQLGEGVERDPLGAMMRELEMAPNVGPVSCDEEGWGQVH